MCRLDLSNRTQKSWKWREIPNLKLRSSGLLNLNNIFKLVFIVSASSQTKLSLPPDFDLQNHIGKWNILNQIVSGFLSHSFGCHKMLLPKVASFNGSSIARRSKELLQRWLNFHNVFPNCSVSVIDEGTELQDFLNCSSCV